jgi:hypothetical protein
MPAYVHFATWRSILHRYSPVRLSLGANGPWSQQLFKIFFSKRPVIHGGNLNILGNMPIMAR